MANNLQRFLRAQENSYQDALQELKNGKKTSHWMWYLLPQISGLGKSDIAKQYEIESEDEAFQYLQHEILSVRLLKLTSILVDEVNGKSAEEIFGFPDYLKFQSSLTLFNFIAEKYREQFSSPEFQVFKLALDKYYKGEKDCKTLEILNGQK